jgi:predicted TIM-barrel fold metal-dependent hydrolase
MTIAALRSAVEVLSAEQVVQYLDKIRDICGTRSIVDVHVHATEVIRGRTEYACLTNGIYSESDSQPYHAPKVSNVRLTSIALGDNVERQNKLSELAFTRAYRHTGPTVLGHQLDLAGVDKAALLPVSSSHSQLGQQMEVIRNCCSSDSRFIAGYCIPHDVPIDKIGDELRKALDEYDIRIVKVHPNISDIDLTSAAGRDRLQAIIQACGSCSLPALLHGGCSPILGDVPARKFSTIENLDRIDWSRTSSPVIIAHFGLYGCSGNDELASKESLKQLIAMLNRHPNLFTDTSGVSYDIIKQMLSALGPDKVVFGSDALYVPVYRQLALVAHAMHELGMELAEIRRIACDNPGRIFHDIS